MTPLILGIDTETSGLVRKELPLDDPSQPRLLEVAVKLVDDEGTVFAAFHAIIKPDGWSVESGAEAVHGISEAKAHRVGISVLAALIVVQSFAAKASIIVGHNVEFDWQIIASEVSRAKGEGKWWRSRRNDLRCTMLASAPILKIPGDYGDYRWPKLEAAYNHFYPDEPWNTVHSAESDLDATLRLWRAIQRETADAH